LDFKNLGKSAGSVTQYYSSFALRESKCSGRYSSSFPVQNSFENYILPKVAEVLVVQKWQKFSSVEFNPKVLTVYTRSLLTSKVSWARRQTKRVQMYILPIWEHAV